MTATKKKSSAKAGLLMAGAAVAFVLVQRRWLIAAVLLVLAGLGVSAAWRHWGGAVVAHPSYAIQAENIAVTPQPEWVHTDVKAEVVRNGSLEKLQLLDPQVTVKVARAFEIHNWVASVQRVSKQYPAKIVVELEYRRPVAMVEVLDNGKPGLVPIDGHGVVLPPENFAEQTRNYLRIFAGETVPAGPVGTPWGDERVLGAASIALALSPHWKKLDLYRIRVTDDTLLTKKPAEIVYEVTNRDKAKILWGHAPGAERTGEASATEKLARLLAFAEKHGPFSPDTASELDLRSKAGMATDPATAERLRNRR